MAQGVGFARSQIQLMPDFIIILLLLLMLQKVAIMLARISIQIAQGGNHLDRLLCSIQNVPLLLAQTRFVWLRSRE